jgi:N-acetylglucosaminyl-diphospho-decaprenol L-rhamnosyltransferase
MHGRVSTVAVIVVNWNTRELLAQCLESIQATSGGVDIETVVVDNASTDGSAEMVGASFPAVRVIKNPDNRGFARANNQAIAATTAPYVLMLNSDARLTPGALQCLLERLTSTPRAGLVGARIDNPDGSFQASHMRFPNLAREALIVSGLGRLLYGASYPSSPPQPNGAARVVEWVSGACMLARRSALAQVGGFDEGYFLYGE